LKKCPIIYFLILKSIVILLYIVIIFSKSIYAQTFSIKGRVVDEQTIPLPGVNVVLINTNYGSATNDDGYYEISNLPPGIFTIEYSAIGYEKIRKEDVTILDKSIVLDIVLAEAAIETEEVIVTAGKFKQKQSDLTVSSEVIHSEEFENRNFSNLEDAIRFVRGITMTDDQISIRGSSGYSRGTGARALMAIDGLPFYTGDTGEIVWEMIPVTELSRVEIIKGATSSLYGSAAIGGVLNCITRNISEKPLTIINGFYGMYDRPYYDEWDWSGERRPFNGLTLAHSQQIDKFGFNISFTRLEDASYREDDDFKKYIGFLKTVFNFTPVSSLTFIANTFNKRAGNFLYWKNSQNALIPPDRNEGDEIETDRYLIGLIYSSLLNDDLLLNLRGSYYRNYFVDNEITANESTSNLYRGEVQLHSTVSGFVSLTGGVEGIASTVRSSLFGNPHSFQTGIYLLSDINFSFPLIASIGIRYDYSKLDTLDGTGAISPKLGLNYKLTHDLVLRSAFGIGFRAPSIAEAFTSTSTAGITVKPNPNIQPEHNYTFEVGFNYNYSTLFNLDVAVFFSNYKDLIEPVIDPADGFAYFNNVLEAQINGVEAGLIIFIIPEVFNLNVNYTYLHAEDVVTGKALRYRPKNILYAGLTLNKWNFQFGINFRYISKVEEVDEELVDLGIVVDGDLRVPTYTTDLNFGYSFVSLDLPLSLYLNVKNIFNYNYVELIGNIRPIRNFAFGFNLAF
jgi:outer membrane receptor for ferrienterochelin and colicins